MDTCCYSPLLFHVSEIAWSHVIPLKTFSLCNYQSKASRYSKGLAYLKTKVFMKQRHTIDSQKSRRKLKPNTNEYHQIHKRKNKKRKKYQIIWKTKFKTGNAAAAAAKSLQLYPTLCDPIDGSPPGPTIPGILQARTLEWVAISSSNA